MKGLNSSFKKHIFRTVMLILCVCCGLSCVQAQVQVQANMDSVSILIGRQAHIYLQAVVKKNSSVSLPEYKPLQQLTPGVEVVETSRTDTTEVDEQHIRVSKNITITSFDENVYAIDGLPVRVDGKIYKSNALALKVLTVEVDTLHPDKIYPPKGVQELPFDWADWRSVWIMSMCVLILSMVGVVLWWKWKTRKPIVKIVRRVKRVPAHVKALDDIEELKHKETLLAEHPKEYYTQLTDVLRQYISERFGFNAKEMTSYEIIRHLEQHGDAQMVNELRELFTTADLVKFAKHSTLLNENDRNLLHAMEFVDRTKRNQQVTEEVVLPEWNEAERKAKRSRKWLAVLVVADAVAIVLLLALVAYQLYELLE